MGLKRWSWWDKHLIRHKTNANYENLVSDKAEKEWQRICYVTCVG